jgi:hypothetical protein
MSIIAPPPTAGRSGSSEPDQVPSAPARQGGLRAALGVYAQSRLLTLVVATVAGMRVGVGPLAVLNRWDAGWFLRVVEDGYPHHVPTVAGQAVESTLAFFPLFPLLIKFVAFFTPLSNALAGVAVSVAAGAVTVAVVHRIALRLTGDSTRALRAVTLWAFFPGSMVLSMPYSEGVMVALAALCLLALLDERWWTAGLCAALASGSRASALALVPVCLWQAVQVYRRDRSLRPFMAPLLAPLGTVAYFLFLWAHTGDPLTYLHAEAAWNSGLTGFGEPALHMAWGFVRAPFTEPMAATATLSLVFAAVTSVILVRRRWPSVLSVYTFTVLMIAVLTRTDGLRPRDLLTAFPLFLACADVLNERWMRYAAPASAALLAVSLTFHNLGSWAQP